ncbi:MAG: PAS domain S-box protein [Bryobacterales bacterium]|nr:PAS domain S-box protein [Bryobacterales bacterium]
MDQIVFPLSLLIAFATLLPAAGLFLILSRRIRAEREKQRSALAEIESGSATAMLTFEVGGQILRANSLAGKLFECTEQELAGMAIGSLIPVLAVGGDGLVPTASLVGARKTPNGIGVEVTGQRKNGTYIPLDVLLTEMPGMRPKRFQMVARDLSDVHDIQRNWRELQFLDGMLQSVGAPLLVLYKDGKVTRHNRAFEQITGHSDPFGRHYWELLLAPEEWPQARHTIAETISTAATRRMECTWLRPSGEPVQVTLAITPLRAGNTTPEHAVVAAFPVSERAETGRWATMEAVERLAGGIAQQFNDLLTSINGYSELVLHTVDESSPARRDVEEIKKAGERGAALTAQLLAFSQRQVLRPSVLSLNHLIHEMKETLSVLLGERMAVCTILDLELWQVNADRSWLEQVILNLAVNARDAMHDGGKLTLETMNESLDGPDARRQANLPEGQYVVLAVTDTGSGLAPAAREHLFEPFFSTKRSKGAGLGLSTVYGVVRQSGGNVLIHSVPAGGTAVRIYLPRFAAEAESAEKAARGLYLVRGAGN